MLSRAELSVIPWTVALQAPLSREFSRQEYYSGYPFPSLENLPDPGIELESSTLQWFFSIRATKKFLHSNIKLIKKTLKENLRSGKTSVTFEYNKINYWQKDCKSYVKTVNLICQVLYCRGCYLKKKKKANQLCVRYTWPVQMFR